MGLVSIGCEAITVEGRIDNCPEKTRVMPDMLRPSNPSSLLSAPPGPPRAAIDRSRIHSSFVSG